MGGKQDAMINTDTDRHSKVFENETELASMGYIDASHDDMLALTPNVKVGLVYHGTKSYKNTTWNKV
jgi:Gene product 88